MFSKSWRDFLRLLPIGSATKWAEHLVDCSPSLPYSCGVFIVRLQRAMIWDQVLSFSLSHPSCFCWHLTQWRYFAVWSQHHKCRFLRNCLVHTNCQLQSARHFVRFVCGSYSMARAVINIKVKILRLLLLQLSQKHTTRMRRAWQTIHQMFSSFSCASNR